MIEGEAEQSARSRRQEKRRQRADGRQHHQPVHRIGTDHDDIAMRDVEEAHRPVDQVESKRDAGVEAAGDQRRGEQLWR
jgi:hypothetical protein